MTAFDILSPLGQFSPTDAALFEKRSKRKKMNKNGILLSEGEICQSVFFILSGCCYQFQNNEGTENIIDLHLPHEWMFNQSSLITQCTSTTTIKAFTAVEAVELSLQHLHELIAQSPAFLQLGSLFNQANHRTHLFDNSLNPADKYRYISEAKPLLAQLFPVKMIASYLKIAPETLSRVRAGSSIS